MKWANGMMRVFQRLDYIQSMIITVQEEYPVPAQEAAVCDCDYICWKFPTNYDNLYGSQLQSQLQIVHSDHDSEEVDRGGRWSRMIKTASACSLLTGSWVEKSDEREDLKTRVTVSGGKKKEYLYLYCTEEGKKKKCCKSAAGDDNERARATKVSTVGSKGHWSEATTLILLSPFL